MSPLTGPDFRRIFSEIDRDRDGFVNLIELNHLPQKLGWEFSSEDLESLVGKTMMDSGEFSSFCNSLFRRSGGEADGVDGDDDVETEKDLMEAFRVFDLDGDGFITSQELESSLKKLGFWDEESGMDSRDMISKYDANMDGKVDFEEFKKMMFKTMSLDSRVRSTSQTVTGNRRQPEPEASSKFFGD